MKKKLLSIFLFLFLYLLLFSSELLATEVKIAASDAEAGDQFGYSTAISGDYVIVGASREDGDIMANAGAAYIYHREGANWTQQAKLIASDAMTSDYFGSSVSISGDYAVVGAYAEDEGGGDAGAAYIFIRSGTSWTQQTKIIASDAQAGDHFGLAVSISGDYIVVGANSEDEGGSDAGAAYIFYRSGTSWTEQEKITASDAQAGDDFGSSVSISGDYAIVGASDEDAGGSDAGAAYIFVRSGTSWTQQAKINASDADDSDSFGNSICISGDYAVVGAVGEDAGGFRAGAAYVFNRSGETWVEQAKITASEPQASDYFGQSVSISGDFVVVGAYGKDTAGSAAGTVYSYLRNGISWPEISNMSASDAQASDYFGFSVSISGAYAIVGAYGEDDGGSIAGAAYIYESVADLSLPVDLSSFSAAARDGQVTLKWTTASEINNDAFLLERSEDGEKFELLTEIDGQGSTSNETNYSFTDNTVYNGFTYYYRLADRDINGVVTYHTIVNAVPNAMGIDFESTDLIIENFALHSNCPNPFNPETSIRFDVPTISGKLQNINLQIFNALGQLISTLYNGQISGGQYELKWNAVNQPSGVYFLNFQSDQFVQTQKMILLR